MKSLAVLRWIRVALDDVVDLLDCTAGYDGKAL